MTNVFQGYRATPDFLEVCFKAERGTTVRFETVRIPWSDLVVDQDLVDRLNIAVAKHLSQIWGAEPDTHPLF